MILFAETNLLVAYKEAVGEQVRVIFETVASETFTLSARQCAGVDVADELFRIGLADYLNGLKAY